MFELDGKIEINYHHFQDDGSLCLGATIDLYAIFFPKPCLDTFMNDILNPYLYRWLYIKKFRETPWIDRSHGKEGLVEAYAELLEIPPEKTVVKSFIALLAANNARANSPCPCNSGKKVKSCHRKKLEKLQKLPPQIFLQDFFLFKGIESL